MSTDSAQLILRSLRRIQLATRNPLFGLRLNLIDCTMASWPGSSRGTTRDPGEEQPSVPAEKGSCLGDVGTALHWIVDGQRLIADLALRAGDGENLVCTVFNGPLHRVADIHRKMFAGT